MLKILVLIFSFVAMTVSCATPPAGKHAANWSPAGRTPTALKDFYLDDSEATQEIIAEVLNGLTTGDKAITANLEDRVKMIIEAISRGYQLMGLFDKELDNAREGGGFELASSANYRKLQALRAYITQLEQQVASGYAITWKVYKGEVDGMTSPEVKQRAAKYIQGFHVLIAQETTPKHGVSEEMARLHRLSLNNLASILYVLQKKMNEDINVSDKAENKLYTDLQKMISRIRYAPRTEGGNGGNEITTYNAVIKAMKEAAAALGNDTELAKILDQESTREPQSNVLVAGFINKSGGDFGPNKWVLTFDDGPNKTQTPLISAALLAQGVHGEFFWLSNLVSGNGTLAKSILDAGHHVNDHSIDHKDLTKLNEAQIKNEVSGSRDVIEKTLHDKGATNFKVVNFRCPYGACWAPKSAKVQQAIVNAGLTHIYWTVDSLDWQDKNVDSVLARVLKQMKASGKGIVLFHDIHPIAAQVLPKLFKSQYVIDHKVEWLQL